MLHKAVDFGAPRRQWFRHVVQKRTKRCYEGKGMEQILSPAPGPVSGYESQLGVAQQCRVYQSPRIAGKSRAFLNQYLLVPRWLLKFVLLFLFSAVALAAMAADYPPADHLGADLILQNGDRIWGIHYSIGTFQVPADATIHVLPHAPELLDSGFVEIHASNILIAGTIDAAGAGYKGGDGGDGGKGGGRNEYQHPYPAAAGGSGWAGVGLAGGLPGQDGGYDTPEGNTDQSKDFSIAIGSGGGGGNGGNGGDLVGYGPGGGGGGGGAGGCGGGCVKLLSRDSTIISGIINTLGACGGNGANGTDGYDHYDLEWGWIYEGGSGGAGGKTVVFEQGLGGEGGNGDQTGKDGSPGERGGAGAGGGILIYCESPDALQITGMLDVHGGRNQLTNGGTVKIFYRSSVNIGTVYSARTYSCDLDTTTIATPTPTPTPRPAGPLLVAQSFETIQEALYAARDGDEIIVAPGTYMENIQFWGKNVLLHSSDPTTATIIDGGGRASAITFDGSELSSCVVSGFVITNGAAVNGGGITGNGTHATIINNTIINNVASGGYPNGDGGGIWGCQGLIIGNTVKQNSARYGGGLSDCNGSVMNNSISDNLAHASGGGLYSCNGVVQQDIIRGNSANSGGGLSRCNGTIQNNMISANSVAIEGGGVRECEGEILNNTICGNSADHNNGGGLSLCNGTIRNCIVWQNEGAPQLYCCAAPSYSCIQDWTGGGTGNIAVDPQFVDPERSDYHLFPTSPCVDAGGTVTVNQDFEGDPRPYDVVTRETRGDGSNFDIGADEFIGSAPAPTPGCCIRVPQDYATIQEAINAAPDGCAVVVSEGVYYENIHFHGKNIILRSTDPANPIVVSGTIIDGNSAGSVVTFSGTESSDCVLCGLTITHGYAAKGGGICGNGARASIRSNNITTNTAYRYLSFQGWGGGLHGLNGIIEDNIISANSSSYAGGGLYGCNGTIQHNIITCNSAYRYGGGLYGCDGYIKNNVVLGNYAGWYGTSLYDLQSQTPNNGISGKSPTTGYGPEGGGLYLCNGIIENNLIYQNQARTNGGGLAHCNGTIQNNIISRNSAMFGGGLFWCNPAIIRNCIIWRNDAVENPQLDTCSIPSYSCIEDWTGGGTGNIADNPQLANPDNGDFRLLPTSPCIDAGGTVTLAEDFEGDPRPWDGTSEPRGDGSDFDIGADEYIGSIGFNFDASAEGWTSGTAEVFAAPGWRLEAGSVRLVSANNTNTFGFWQSPENAVPANERYLYRARWVVTTDVTDATRVPTIRLRANAASFHQADVLTIDSVGDGGASPTPSGATYDLYFVPPANDYFCTIVFDLLNFDASDAPSAEVALESVEVERVALNTLGSPFQTWAFEFATGQETWTSGDGRGVFSDPEFFWAGGALVLRSATNTNTFGYWHSAAADIITSTTPMLYRGTFDVRTDVTDKSRVPQMRLRFNTENLQASRTMSIESLPDGEAGVGDGANSPGTANTRYDRLYFLPPANCLGGGLIVSFDMLNFSPDDAPNGRLTLERATIEALSPPSSP
jgi:hypothetical protein